MKLYQYLDKVKVSQTQDELINISVEAVEDDSIEVKDYIKIKDQIDKRKTELNLPQYTTGSRTRHDE